MFFSEALKRPIHVASRSVNSNGVSVYSTPVLFNVNFHDILPTSASADLVEVGTSYFDYLYVVGDPEYLQSINALDKVYVDNPVPQTTDPLAKDADYIVAHTIVSPTCKRVILRRNVVVE